MHFTMAGRRGPTRREEIIMTENKAQKSAIRQRMAATGEPYSVARREVEREHSGDEADPDSTAPDSTAPDSTGPDSTSPREGGLSAQERLDRARELAEQAQERAERSRERAEQADEAAMMAHDAADMATEAATLTRGWADEQEQEQAQLRAAQARTAAEEAQRRADRAEHEAERAEDAADRAEEEACEAEAEACHAEGEDDGWESGGRPRYRARPVRYHRGRWDGPEPPAAKAAKAPATRPDLHGEPADRIAERFGQVLQRFDEFRERAEGMVSQVERIFNLPRDQAPPPSHAEPRPAEAPEHPDPAGSAGSD